MKKKVHGPTPRQLEILRLTAAGLTYKEIALRLCIRHHTVRDQMWRLYKRLGLPSDGKVKRFVAIMTVVRLGLLTLGDKEV